MPIFFLQPRFNIMVKGVMQITPFLFLFLLFSFSPAHSTLPDFTELAEKTIPTVVNISTSRSNNTTSETTEALPHGLEEQPTLTLGSGFIIDKEGYIATNYHVIENATEIHVILSNNQSYVATVAGKDPKTDLALLKITPKEPLPTVTFGNSDAIKVGQWIMAIGNPFGLGGTVTTGIISSQARDINTGIFDNFLQTDAAINSGNSGGPMFNLKGEVIGINTVIVSPSGGSIGIGFATPSNRAKPILEALKEHGHIARGWLGVQIYNIADETAKSLGITSSDGVLVSMVTETGPAAQALIRPGDVITQFNKTPIRSARILRRLLANTAPGDVITLTLLRNGEAIEKSITLKDMPQTP